jgi:hypothetical protein
MVIKQATTIYWYVLGMYIKYEINVKNFDSNQWEAYD